jgi:hypothetical protein
MNNNNNNNINNNTLYMSIYPSVYLDDASLQISKVLIFNKVDKGI